MSKNVLVIDDEESVRKAFTLALEDSKYHLDTAESGEKGVELKNKNDYSLVFLDLKMPGMNGVETLRAIRETDATIPIYIVTAFHKEFLEELQAVQRDGLQFQLLRKPIGNDEILTILDSVLGTPQSY